jgi:hypothetical protein
MAEVPAASVSDAIRMQAGVAEDAGRTWHVVDTAIGLPVRDVVCERNLMPLQRCAGKERIEGQ